MSSKSASVRSPSWGLTSDQTVLAKNADVDRVKADGQKIDADTAKAVLKNGDATCNSTTAAQLQAAIAKGQATKVNGTSDSGATN